MGLLESRSWLTCRFIAIHTQAMPKTRSGLQFLAIQAGEGTLRPQGEFQVKRVVRGHAVIAADGLYDAANLFQRSVIEHGIKRSKIGEECLRLGRRNSAPFLANQESVQHLDAPKGGNDGLLAGPQPVKHVDERAVCSSGKHQDRVTEASTTIPFTGAPHRAVAGSSHRPGRDRGFFQTSSTSR